MEQFLKSYGFGQSEAMLAQSGSGEINNFGGDGNGHGQGQPFCLEPYGDGPGNIQGDGCGFGPWWTSSAPNKENMR